MPARFEVWKETDGAMYFQSAQSLIATRITTEIVSKNIEESIRDLTRDQVNGKRPVYIPLGYEGTKISLEGHITDATIAAWFISLRPDMLLKTKVSDYWIGGNFQSTTTYHELFPVDYTTETEVNWEIASLNISREQGQKNFWTYSLSLIQQNYLAEGYR